MLLVDQKKELLVAASIKIQFLPQKPPKRIFWKRVCKKTYFWDVVDVTQKKELGGSLQTRVIEKAAEPETAFPPQR